MTSTQDATVRPATAVTLAQFRCFTPSPKCEEKRAVSFQASREDNLIYDLKLLAAYDISPVWWAQTVCISAFLSQVSLMNRRSHCIDTCDTWDTWHIDWVLLEPIWRPIPGTPYSRELSFLGFDVQTWSRRFVRLLVNKIFALPRKKGDEGTLVSLPSEVHNCWKMEHPDLYRYFSFLCFWCPRASSGCLGQNPFQKRSQRRGFRSLWRSCDIFLCMRLHASFFCRSLINRISGEEHEKEEKKSSCLGWGSDGKKCFQRSLCSSISST